MRRAFALVLCAGRCSPAWHVAQPLRPRRSDVRRRCAVDFLRYCRDVPPGRGRIMVCMQLNADKLSPRCFEAMTAWGLAAAGAFKACLPDAQKYCSHVPPGMGRGLACILQNADRLSPACREALFGEEFFEPPGGRATAGSSGCIALLRSAACSPCREGRYRHPGGRQGLSGAVPLQRQAQQGDDQGTAAQSDAGRGNAAPAEGRAQQQGRRIGRTAPSRGRRTSRPERDGLRRVEPDPREMRT